jgi:hypothetical protein
MSFIKANEFAKLPHTICIKGKACLDRVFLLLTRAPVLGNSVGNKVSEFQNVDKVTEKCQHSSDSS